MPPRRMASAAETPQRATRARSKTPLPAIDARQSHAYGASGKANLGSQLRTSAEFSQQFEEGRVEGDGGAAAPVAESGRRDGGRPPVIPEEETELESRAPTPPARQATVLDHSAFYRGVVARIGQGIGHQLANPHSVFWALCLFVAILGLGIILGVLSLVVFDERVDNLTKNWFNHKEILFWKNKMPQVNYPELQWAINQHLERRIIALEGRVTTIEETLALDHATLEETRRMLPEHVLLEIVDGKPQIPADFWTALEGRLTENTNLAPAWQAWLTQNNDRLYEMMRETTGVLLADQVEQGRVIQRDEFVKALDEQNNFLVSQYKDQILELSKKQAAEVREITKASLDEAMAAGKHFDMVENQLKTLMKFHHIHNTFRELHTVNWFSVGNGARINPHLTSATKIPGGQGWGAALFNAWNPLFLTPHPPIAALTKWDEAKDCWCGTPAGNGYVQIGIMTAGPVYAGQLVIEHIFRKATLDPESTPKDIEVWMDLGSEKKAQEYMEKYDGDINFVESGPCGESPGKSFMCVFKGTYDINGSNNIQPFTLWPSTRLDKVATRQLLVRATSNYGGDYTCFYRLRLIGIKPDPVKEAEQEANGRYVEDLYAGDYFF